MLHIITCMFSKSGEGIILWSGLYVQLIDDLRLIADQTFSIRCLLTLMETG